VALLELRDIRVEYRSRGRDPIIAVAGVSLTVERGEIVALVGETGCGKSTLAKATVGLLPLSSGSVQFEGRTLTALTRRRRSHDAARLQLVFQNPYSSLNPRRKVGAQVSDALEILDLVPRRERHERVLHLLNEVQIPLEAVDGFPQQFSGGQRQRIAIARVLAAEPSCIVMDEPFSALDASAQAQIAEMLVRLTSRRNVGILLISHDLAIVRHIATKVAVMYLGLVVEVARTKELWALPKHPYTQALIRSIPRADGSGVLPEALSGEVPNPALPPAGCRFHPRCPVAFDRCRTNVPPMTHLEGGRMGACWLLEDNISTKSRDAVAEC
jgi:oligopeptide/dipeptide ABC transporter ATP-binding protein